jgi:hypothetical protein
LSALRRQWRGLAIALVLAGVLLYFALRGIDWGELLRQLRAANPAYIGLAVFAYTVSTFLRSVRWRVLLASERNVPPLQVFWATAAGYLGNGFLPARAGEVIRSAMLSRRTGLNLGFIFATAATERILDAIGLVVIALGALATIQNTAEWVVQGARAMAVLGVVGLAVLLVLPRFEWLALAIIGRLPLPPRIGAVLMNLTSRFLVGLRAIRDPGRAGLFYAMTLVIWLIDGVAAVLTAQAHGLSLAYAEGIVLLAALGLASAAPSTPGFVGIYQFVATQLLPGFGFTREQALAYILTLQGAIYLTIIPWGLLGLWRLSARGPDEK